MSCRRNQNSIEYMMVKHKSQTRMESYEFKYEYKIKNFSRSIGTEIEFPSFSSPYSEFGDQWILNISSDYLNETGYGIEVVAHLKLLSFNNTSEIQTKCKLIINNKKGIIRERTISTFPESIVWDRYRTTWLGPGRNLQNDIFSISCTITLFKKQKDTSNENLTISASPRLSVYWKKLLSSEKSTDVTIRVGKKSFRAIKGILGVRSPVFYAMFTHAQLKENETNEVVIDDIEEEVFEEFLHYIYTDESPNVKKMPMELLAVAEKYQVDCLKNICEEVIFSTINVDNVASILHFSHIYNLKKLNKECVEFIKKDSKAVLSNETFQAYKKKHLEFFVRVLEELLLYNNVNNLSDLSADNEIELITIE